MVAHHKKAKMLKNLHKFGSGMKKFRAVTEGIFNIAKPFLGLLPGNIGGAVAAGGDALFGISHIGDNMKERVGAYNRSYNRGHAGVSV
jgi:hypothetical protein